MVEQVSGNRSAYTHTGGKARSYRKAEDRQCSDCLWAVTVPSSTLGKPGKPAVFCQHGHWRLEHRIDQMPEDIAQGCGDFDDMDEVVT